MLTKKQVAERLNMCESKIGKLIRSGVLSAIDCSQPGAKKKTYRVTEEQLALFIKSRTTTVPTVHPRPRKRSSNVKQFF